MIGLKGTLNVIDNSGAIIAECIRVMSGARFARAGNFQFYCLTLEQSFDI
jgi:ribosomal protein L14